MAIATYTTVPPGSLLLPEDATIAERLHSSRQDDLRIFGLFQHSSSGALVMVATFLADPESLGGDSLPQTWKCGWGHRTSSR